MQHSAVKSHEQVWGMCRCTKALEEYPEEEDVKWQECTKTRNTIAKRTRTRTVKMTIMIRFAAPYKYR